jgi:hypothetical protein
MGPIFNLSQCVKSADRDGAAARRAEHEARIAMLLADGGQKVFEDHPDIKEVVAMLTRWYGDQ